MVQQNIHVVIPGGGVNKSRRQWKKNKGKYLFNEKNLAKVFRARFLEALNESKLPIPRKVRDYGFLHGNAKKLLSLVQLILHVTITGTQQRPRPVFKCPCCKTAMIILGFRQFAWESG